MVVSEGEKTRRSNSSQALTVEDHQLQVLGLSWNSQNRAAGVAGARRKLDARLPPRPLWMNG